MNYKCKYPVKMIKKFNSEFFIVATENCKVYIYLSNNPQYVRNFNFQKHGLVDLVLTTPNNLYAATEAGEIRYLTID